MTDSSSPGSLPGIRLAGSRAGMNSLTNLRNRSFPLRLRLLQQLPLPQLKALLLLDPRLKLRRLHVNIL